MFCQLVCVFHDVTEDKLLGREQLARKDLINVGEMFLIAPMAYIQGEEK